MHDEEPIASDCARPLDRPDTSDKLFWATLILFVLLFLAQTVHLRP